MAHPKGILIERSKKLGLPKPSFNTKSTGPKHEPTFISDVLVGGEVYGTGQGANKRDAEKHASEEALAHLDRLEAGNGSPGPDSPRPGRTERPRTEAQAEQPQAEASEGGFEGPWPIFPEVLAASLTVANSRVDGKKQGDQAIAEVQALALALYKRSLEDLGEIVEVDDDD